MTKYIDIRNSEDVKQLLNSETIDTGEAVIRVYDGVTVDGKGKKLKGNGKGHCLEILGSDVHIANLKISSYFAGVWIEAHRDLVNITVENCVFEDIESEGVSTVIREDGCSITDISVSDNTFIAPSKERTGHCSTAVNFMTGSFSDDRHPIHNVALRQVKCERNRIIRNPDDLNPFMLGITVHGNSAYAFYDNSDMLGSAYNDASDSIEEDIIIKDNFIDGAFDISIDVLAGFPGIGYSLLKNVVISGNTITYHNTAINLGTCNIPCNGRVENCHTENVLIENNTLMPNVPGPNEPQIGIMLFTIRAESLKINCHNCHMRDVKVINNTIQGREIGIALQAVHATQDLPFPSHLYDCSLKEVIIEGNTVTGASQPVRIFAAHLEGRYDPFWGFVLDDFDETLPYSTHCEGAVIDKVRISSNTFNTYDVAYTIGAAWGAGHSFISDCQIGSTIEIENNDCRSDNKVFCYQRNVMNELMYDDAMGSGNRIFCDFRHKQH